MSCRRKLGTAQPANRRDSQSGIALLIALLIIASLTALSLSLVLFTQSETELGGTIASESQAYYAAVAGLEEARGRLYPLAPDAITTLPQQVNQVLYLVNGSHHHLVKPLEASSPYYDYEYAQEFPGGFASAQVLPWVASDQPGAGTPYVIPYKWVRITLATEYASKTDVNQDGILNSTTPIYWDGAHQNLTPPPNGIPVYMLTALAEEPNSVRKILQEEVVATPPLVPAGGVETAGFATLTGLSARLHRSANLTLDGKDACGGPSVPGIAAGSRIRISGRSNISSSLQDLRPFPQSAPSIIQSLLPGAVPILDVDPKQVTLTAGGGSLVGTNVTLGQLPGGSSPGQPVVVYADRSLEISGFSSTGYGILLVNGNLSITGGFNYQGLIVANGEVTLDLSSRGSIDVLGSLISSGNLSINSSASPRTSVNLNYDSCVVRDAYRSLPLVVRSFKQLSF